MTTIDALRQQMREYFAGKEEVIENLLVCLLAEGHVLLEDVPGVGKTTLARILANAMEADFGRIQFTPDTLPGDVLGVSVYNMKTQEFEYREGAVMHQVLLADEINRTSPKTQAGLLEAMAEKQVTVDGIVHPLPELFMVIATQNPVEFVGTYPLPEAQMDRFMMKLSIGYPSLDEELRMMNHYLQEKVPEHMKKVCSAEDILRMRGQVKKIYVSAGVQKYIRDIVELTRQEKKFVLGASPRAVLLLLRAAQAKAFLSGREFVKPDDVKAVAMNVLHHRLVLTADARIAGEDCDRVLGALLLRAKVPLGDLEKME